MRRYNGETPEYAKGKYVERMKLSCKVFFPKIEKAMRDEQLYLDPELSLAYLARRLGTNRTYISQAFNQNDTNYWKYLNSLKIEHLISILVNVDLASYSKEDIEMMANTSGFKSRRAMDRILAKTVGKTIYEIAKDGL